MNCIVFSDNYKQGVETVKRLNFYWKVNLFHHYCLLCDCSIVSIMQYIWLVYICMYFLFFLYFGCLSVTLLFQFNVFFYSIFVIMKLQCRSIVFFKQGDVVTKILFHNLSLHFSVHWNSFHDFMSKFLKSLF